MFMHTHYNIKYVHVPLVYVYLRSYIVKYYAALHVNI